MHLESPSMAASGAIERRAGALNERITAS